MVENKKITYESPEDAEVDREQPLMSHFLELRSRQVSAAVSVLVVFAVLSPFMKHIFDFFKQPLMAALPQGVKMLSTGVVAPFFVPFKVTLFLAFLIALPYVLYQVWAFVAPGLYKREKRLIFHKLASSIVMFAAGMLY